MVRIYLNEADLEFIWVGDDVVDPLQQAQTLNILVGAGIKTRDEARADLGLAPEGGKNGELGKWNFDPDQPRDEWGRWTTDGDADSPGSKQPQGVQVAFNGAATTMTDAGGLDIDLTTADDAATAAGLKVAYPEGWQACHERCLAETEGVWPPSDRPGLYRRCVRACLGAAGDNY